MAPLYGRRSSVTCQRGGERLFDSLVHSLEVDLQSSSSLSLQEVTPAGEIFQDAFHVPPAFDRRPRHRLIEFEESLRQCTRIEHGEIEPHVRDIESRWTR